MPEYSDTTVQCMRSLITAWRLPDRNALNELYAGSR